MKEMNKYVVIGLCLILIFFGQPRRSMDPLGAVVITALIGVILILIALFIDFVIKPIRKKYSRRLYPEVCLAAADGHAARVTELVSAGASPNEICPSGATSLMLAAENGHLNAVDALLAAGADPGLTTSKGKTALAIALRLGHKEVAERLRKSRE